MRRMSAIILATAVLAALPVAGQSKGAKSQAKATASKPAPRMPDGKPDLSGFWQGPLLRNMFESVGGPPFTPTGEAAYRYSMTQSINPEGLCLFAGIPRASISGVPFEILQHSSRLAFLYELMPG